MCELFAKSSRHACTVTLALDEFAMHGGRTGPHKDGWGIAYYEEGDIRLIKDTHRAYDNPWERFVRDQGLEACTIISHIRNATTGRVSISNTHPFARELGGRMHVFAHNGEVDEIFGTGGMALGRYRPIGATDSEHAFCALMEAMADLWVGADGTPALERRMDLICAFAERLRGYGSANFLYADGETLFAHSHVRRQNDGVRRPPGLHMLQRSGGGDEPVIEGGGVAVGPGPEGQRMTLLASVPLTEEDWIPLGPGTLIALEHGEVVAQRG